MISMTHITAQKPHGRQLKVKVCGSESAIFLILLSFFLVKTTNFNNDISKNGSSTHRHFITKLILITVQSFATTQRLHSYEFIPVDKTVLSSACRTPFSNVVRMRTCSIDPKPKTTVIGLGARLVHT